MAFAHQNFFCIIQIRFISSWHSAYAFTFVKWFCVCVFFCPLKKYALCGDFSLVRCARSTLVSFYIPLLMKTKFNGLQQNETNTRWIEMEVVISWIVACARSFRRRKKNERKRVDFLHTERARSFIAKIYGCCKFVNSHFCSLASFMRFNFFYRSFFFVLFLPLAKVFDKRKYDMKSYPC